MRHHLAISHIFGIACVKVLSFQTCVHVVKGNYVDAHWCNPFHCFVTWYALLFVKRCVGRCGLFPGPTIPCTGEKKWAFLRNDKLRRNRTKSLMGGWIFSRDITWGDEGRQRWICTTWPRYGSCVGCGECAVCERFASFGICAGCGSCAGFGSCASFAG